MPNGQNGISNMRTPIPGMVPRQERAPGGLQVSREEEERRAVQQFSSVNLNGHTQEELEVAMILATMGEEEERRRNHREQEARREEQEAREAALTLLSMRNDTSDWEMNEESPPNKRTRIGIPDIIDDHHRAEHHISITPRLGTLTRQRTDEDSDEYSDEDSDATIENATEEETREKISDVANSVGARYDSATLSPQENTLWSVSSNMQGSTRSAAEPKTRPTANGNSRVPEANGENTGTTTKSGRGVLKRSSNVGAKGRSTSKRATAGKATAGKATAGKATAGKATAGKSTAGKSTAGKATVRKANGGKAAARKATARTQAIVQANQNTTSASISSGPVLHHGASNGTTPTIGLDDNYPGHSTQAYHASNGNMAILGTGDAGVNGRSNGQAIETSPRVPDSPPLLPSMPRPRELAIDCNDSLTVPRNRKRKSVAPKNRGS